MQCLVKTYSKTLVLSKIYHSRKNASVCETITSFAYHGTEKKSCDKHTPVEYLECHRPGLVARDPRWHRTRMRAKCFVSNYAAYANLYATDEASKSCDEPCLDETYRTGETGHQGQIIDPEKLDTRCIAPRALSIAELCVSSL